MATSREKEIAHSAVNQAMMSGRLIPLDECERCHARPLRLAAHHYAGYDKTNHLTVQWLCYPCHAEQHRRVPKDEVRVERVVMLVTPKERKMWGKAAKRGQFRSLAQYVRQVVNCHVESVAQRLPVEVGENGN